MTDDPALAPRVVPMVASTLTLPHDHPEGAGKADVLAFLVFDGPTRILVDTGVGEGNSYIERMYAPRNHGLERLLGEHGVALSDIDLIVNSHLHFDHCGGNSLFPGVPIVVQAAELAAAREPRYTVPDWLDFEGVEFRWGQTSGRRVAGNCSITLFPRTTWRSARLPPRLGMPVLS